MEEPPDDDDPGCKCDNLPPCIDPENFPRCHGCLEKGCCCRLVGRLGFERPCCVRRHYWMGGATVLAVAGGLLCIFACLAISSDPELVRKTAWSIGESKFGGGKIYLGLSKLVIYNNGDKVTDVSWKNVDCDALPQLGDDCDDCKDSARGIVQTAIIAAVTHVPTISTYVQRCSRYGDRNCQKTLGIVTGTLGFVSTLSALLSFNANCIDVGSDFFDTKPGRGYVAISLGIVLTFLGVFFHVFLKTPPATYAGVAKGADFDDSGFRKL